MDCADSITKEHLTNSFLWQWNFNLLDFFFVCLLHFKLAIEEDLFSVAGVWCKFTLLGVSVLQSRMVTVRRLHLIVTIFLLQTMQSSKLH